MYPVYRQKSNFTSTSKRKSYNKQITKIPSPQASEKIKGKIDQSLLIPKGGWKYGECRKCHGPIKIPGLDASLCSGACGWVREAISFEMPPPPPPPKSRRKAKAKQSERLWGGEA